MNIRQVKKIINETFEQDDVEQIKQYLKREYWNKIFETNKFEIWEHMDDPSIGQYQLFFNKDKSRIEKIKYTNKFSIFDRIFYDADDFLYHVSDITNEPIDPEAMENGANILKSIANELKNKTKYENWSEEYENGVPVIRVNGKFPKYLYRVMSIDEYEKAKKIGFFEPRLGERIHASSRPEKKYGDKNSVVVRFNYDDNDGWRAKWGDKLYAITNNKIPFSRATLVET